MTPRIKSLVLALVSLLSVLSLTACNPYDKPVTFDVIEKEYEPDTRRYDHVKKKWVGKNECFELDVIAKGGYERELCVSERVWNDAMPLHPITLTKDYH